MSKYVTIEFTFKQKPRNARGLDRVRLPKMWSHGSREPWGLEHCQVTLYVYSGVQCSVSRAKLLYIGYIPYAGNIFQFEKICYSCLAQFQRVVIYRQYESYPVHIHQLKTIDRTGVKWFSWFILRCVLCRLLCIFILDVIRDCLSVWTVVRGHLAQCLVKCSCWTG